nr:mitotic-spindle organizing protein 2B isoform X3 [Jaculus jaculus]
MWRRLAGPWLSAPERGGRGLAALLPAGLRMAAAAAAAAGGGSGLAASAGLEAMTLQKLALRRKKVLSAEEMELDELAQAAGAAIDPDVFKILVDLLNLNVAPIAVYQMLKSMCAGQRLASDGQDPASVSLPTSETREASFLLAKNSSPPALARPSFSCQLRPAASPVLLHGSAAKHLPLSPGSPSLQLSCCLFSSFSGRNRGVHTLSGAPILAERSGREGSIQRMPRQPSATRLPKGSGPGKSTSRGST